MPYRHLRLVQSRDHLLPPLARLTAQAAIILGELAAMLPDDDAAQQSCACLAAVLAARQLEPLRTRRVA